MKLKEKAAFFFSNLQWILVLTHIYQNFCIIITDIFFQIPLRRGVGLFMTSDPSHCEYDSRSMINDIMESFRTISLSKPDLGQILKAKCSALGFRAGNVLALRLKVMTELVKDQL